MKLAEQLIETTPDSSLTLFDKGFYSLGLLNRWSRTGVNKHWLLPFKKGTVYEVILSLGRSDKLVKIKTSPQARKHFSDLPEYIKARIVGDFVGIQHPEISNDKNGSNSQRTRH